jgi:hypothetical protein
MENFSNIKFCIGPMSKNVVDSIIDYVNNKNIKMILIPSRRQVEHDGGYVNNWTTKEFCSYVRNKTNNIFIQRDHGGPGQGTNMDDGLESFKEDAKLLDIIHIDPWKKYQKYNEGLKYTVDLINYCYNLNNKLYFEVATEEAIRPFSADDLRKLMNDLKDMLEQKVFEKIVYLVIQSGTALKEGVNTGVYNNEKLKEMMKLSQEFNILTKEHNGDWISDYEIKDKFINGLSALNIAPEFGMIETKVILSEIDSLDEKKSKEYFEKFFQICYESKKWVKWVKDDFDPFKNKRKLIEICGHYVFTHQDLLRIKHNVVDIDNKIKKAIYERLEHIFKIITKKITRNKSILTNKENIEDLKVIKNFPISMSTVPINYNDFRYLDMIYSICKDTGMIQIRNYPTLEDMYPFQHNFSYGDLWKNLFIKFTDTLNKILSGEKNINIIEIGGGECKLANNLLKTNDKINSYKIFEKNSKNINLNNKIEIIDEYFDKHSKFPNNINVVIHSHLFEHVWNPVEFVETIKNNLNFNSYHCFIIPNILKSFSNKYTNAINFEHNFFIIEEYVDIILNNNGFSILKKEYYNDHSIMYFTILNQKKITHKTFPNLYERNKNLVLNFFNFHENIVKDINLKTKDFNGNLYLFGGHIFTQYLIKFGLDISKVIGILDNCENKNKTVLYGTKFIIDFPNIIKNKENIGIVLRACHYQDAIKKQLLKINKNVIIFE